MLGNLPSLPCSPQDAATPGGTGDRSTRLCKICRGPLSSGSRGAGQAGAGVAGARPAGGTGWRAANPAAEPAGGSPAGAILGLAPQHVPLTGRPARTAAPAKRHLRDARHPAGRRNRSAAGQHQQARRQEHRRHPEPPAEKPHRGRSRLVAPPGGGAVEAHFARAPALEGALRARGRHDLADALAGPRPT